LLDSLLQEILDNSFSLPPLVAHTCKKISTATMSAEDYKGNDEVGKQEDQDLTEKKNDEVDMEASNDGNDFESDEYGDECYDWMDDYDFEMDDDLYEEIDFNLFWEYGSEEAESWRYPWRKSSEPPKEKLLKIEEMLNIWKPHKEKLLEEYHKAENLLNGARKIIAKIESTENNCLSVLQRLHLIHDDILHEIEKAQAKAELEKDEINPKISNANHEINVQLLSLECASFILRTRIQTSTKTTFDQIKEIETLMKTAKETEKETSDSVLSKNKEIAHTERVIFELESDKAKLFKQVDELSDAREIQEDPVIEVKDITT